jgi:hypothetical protein
MCLLKRFHNSIAVAEHIAQCSHQVSTVSAVIDVLQAQRQRSRIDVLYQLSDHLLHITSDTFSMPYIVFYYINPLA